MAQPLRFLLRAAGRRHREPAPDARRRSQPTATERLADYRRLGYTIFAGVYDEATLAALRDEQDRLESAVASGPAEQRGWFGNMLERSPHLMWPAVSQPLLLDFAERLVGPFLQLDNLTLAAFPPRQGPAPGAVVSGWHRDRWGRMPSGHYERPLGLNAICYLQDLTDEVGPLRVIPGSHVEPIAVDADERHRPHPREQLLCLRAGDVVVTHSSLLHSGTPNLSSRKRYLFSVYYNISWLKFTDDFTGPNCRDLIARARRRNDHRSLRLLGVDDHLVNRANSGFQESDEDRWLRWIEEDRRALCER